MLLFNAHVYLVNNHNFLTAQVKFFTAPGKMRKQVARYGSYLGKILRATREKKVTALG